MHLVMKSGELWVIAMPRHIKCHCTLLPSELYLGGACILTEFANIVTFLFVTMQLPLKIWMVVSYSPFFSFARVYPFCFVVRRIVYHCKYFGGQCTFEKCCCDNLILREGILKCVI